MKKILGLVLSLTLISGICAAVLAYVNKITAEPIRDAAAAKELAAVKAVMPAGVEKVEPAEGYYTGFDANGQVIGYAAKGVSDKGYAGMIELMVGFERDRQTVVCYKTLVATETPGLGMKLNTPEFSDQFKGKDATKVKVTKSGAPKSDEIQAITAATITSKAVCGAIADAAGRLK